MQQEENERHHLLGRVIYGSIHIWGTKKECLIEKGLQRTTLDFCLSYIIIIVVDFYMLINKMMSF